MHRIRPLGLVPEAKENAPFQQRGLPFPSKAPHSLYFEEMRERECTFSGLYLDFDLNLGTPGLLFPSFSCCSSLIFSKSNKPLLQTRTKESQGRALGIEAELILVTGEPLWAGETGQKFIWPHAFRTQQPMSLVACDPLGNREPSWTSANIGRVYSVSAIDPSF